MARTSFWQRAASSSLMDLGHLIRAKTYNMVRPLALQELGRELGIRRATLDSIADQKDYSEIGSTEISAHLGDMFAEQPPENLQTLSRLYETHPWVFICTSYIATQLAGIPLRIMKATGFDDGREILEGADDTPVGKLFRWVNPFQSPFEFKEALISWYVLTGEAYIAFTAPGPDTPKGIPAEMYVLFTPFVKKVTSPTKGLLGYEYQVSGNTAYFDKDDVVYLGSYSPAGRFRGQGVPAAAIKTITTDFALREFNENVLSQGVHLSGILETDDDRMDKDGAAIVRQSFTKEYSGSRNASKIAVLWGGLKFNPTTILQKDVMMDTQMDVHKNEIIATFGFKPELFTEKFANKATAETVRRMALEDTILGRYGRKLEAVLSSTGLLRFDPDLRAQFDIRDVPALQTSNKEKTESGALAIQSGQMTINEVRQRVHNLQPIEGIEGDITFIGTQPAAMTLVEPEAPDNSGKLLLPPGTAMGGMIKEAAMMNIVVKASDQEFRVVFNRTRRTAQNRMERALRSTYRGMQKDVTAQITRSTVDTQMMANIEQIMFFDGKKAIVQDVSEAVKAGAQDSIEANLAMLKIETAFDVKPVRALGRLTQQEQRIRNSGARSWTKLRGSLTEGLSGGETQHELTVRVRKHFNGLRNNAETIARTEILPAVNGASFDVAVSARDAGVDVRSRWITSQSERVRTPPRDSKNHVAAHGLEIIPGEEMFSVSGQHLEYPGDSWNGASADNTINCECGIQNFVFDPSKE